MGEYSIETYLTAATEFKFDEGTKLRWTKHSSECETTPPCEELLEFLDVQAQHHESVAHNIQSNQRLLQELHMLQGQTTHVWHVRKRLIH